MKRLLCLTATAFVIWSGTAHAETLKIAILATLTGPLALEGNSSKNGAELAISEFEGSIKVVSEVVDTGASAEGGTNALERVMGAKNLIGVLGPLFGTQMVPMLPMLEEERIPLATLSGVAQLTEKGSKYLFRFFPNDVDSKYVQTVYGTKDGERKRVAIVYNTSAYGQSGLDYLSRYAKRMGAEIVYSEGIELSTKDMTPIVGKLRAANADVYLVQMHTASMALLMHQYAAAGVATPIVGNTFLAQPSTTALLEPSELKGACAETSAWVGQGVSNKMDKFIDAYMKKFGVMPDVQAAGYYDAMKMMLSGISAGARTREALRDYMASSPHEGVAMTYKNDGVGNMAHSVAMVCYDGSSRMPTLSKSFENVVAPK